MATMLTLTPARSSTGSSRNSTWILSPSNLRYTLPFPATSSPSARAASSIFTIRRKASRIIKVTVGAIIGFLGIIATWWALDLAMWTAVKEWRDDCREQKQLNETISSGCADILSKALSPPPTWRSFVYSKIPKRFEPGLGIESAKTLFSIAPRKGSYERMIDDMIERAECSTLCGTPYSDTCGRENYDTARKRNQKQGDAAIMYGGMDSYDNYTVWIEERQRTRSARYWEKSRVNPVVEPCWWSDSWGTILYDGSGEMRCGGGFRTALDKYGASMGEVEILDWSRWADKLDWMYSEKVSISHAGNGSHERLRVEVNEPSPDVWRRGCPCQKPVTNYEIGMGGWNVFDGPSWVFWDTISTMTAVLLMLVYWEWMVGWDLRKRQDAKRTRKMRERDIKVKTDQILLETTKSGCLATVYV